MKFWCKAHWLWAYAYSHDTLGRIEYACPGGLLYPVLRPCDLVQK